MHIGLIIIGLLLVIFILWILMEQKRLITTKYTVTADNLPEAFHNTGFVVLSDLHNYKFGKNNERLFRQIEALSPEFIVVAGDMVNKKSICYPSNAFSLLEQLAKKYKIYYAYGNHEQSLEKLLSAPVFADKKNIGSSWLQYKKALAAMNIIFLENKSILFEKENEKLRITGLSIHLKYFEHGRQVEMEDGYLDALLGKKPEELYNILIAHSPLYFCNYTEWGADLTVSGHLHGGLMRLPVVGGVISPQVRLFPEYSSGLYTEKGKQMIVSRGLGSHSLMPRIWNAPEIVAVKLKKSAYGK